MPLGNSLAIIRSAIKSPEMPVGSIMTFVGSLGNSANINDVGYYNGTGNSARFANLMGLAIDSKKNLYTLARTNSTGTTDTIKMINPDRSVSNVISIDWARNITIDSSDNLYVSQQLYIISGSSKIFSYARIFKITPNKVVSFIAGSNYGFQDGIGINAYFKNPNGLCLDNSNNLYVCDTDNNKIRKIDLSNNNVTSIANIPTPISIIYNPNNNNLYITTPFSTYEFSLSSNTLNPLVSIGSASSSLVLDKNNYLIVITGSKLSKVDIATKTATQLFDTSPTSNYFLRLDGSIFQTIVSGVVFDSNEFLYFIDRNYRIMKCNLRSY